MNTGGFPAFADAQGITPVRVIEPGVIYPFSTMEGPKGEGFRLTPVGPRSLSYLLLVPLGQPPARNTSTALRNRAGSST